MTTITATPGAGPYSTAQNVTLDAGGAAIAYTLDGSDPAWGYSAPTGSWTAVALNHYWRSMSRSGSSIYACSGEITTGRVYKSIDAGLTWTECAGFTSGRYFTVVALGDVVVACPYTGQPQISFDGGATASTISGPPSSSWSCGAARGSTIAIGSGTVGVLWLSTDSGATWASDSPASTVIHALRITESGTILAGTAAGIYRKASGGSWSQVSTVASVYTLTGGDGVEWFACRPGHIYRSTNDGATWAITSSTSRNYVSSAYVKGVAYFGVDPGSIWTTTDGTAYTDAAPGSQVWYCGVDADDHTVLFGAYQYQIYRRTGTLSVVDAGTLYTSAIPISTTTTLKAVTPGGTVQSWLYSINPFSLFGAAFQGFEMGMSVTLERNLREVPVRGGPPRMLETGTADGSLDRWIVEASFTVTLEQAAAFQAACPPYGSGSPTIYLPPRGGLSSFPGLRPATAAATADRYTGVTVRSVESTGQVAPRVDLYGYRIKFELACKVGATAINSATTPTTSVPDVLYHKFRAHQISDWSVQPVAAASGGILSAPLGRVKAGRRHDVGVNLDHLVLSDAEADALVAWARGVRGGKFALDFGPLDDETTYWILKSLSFKRSGSWWDGSLELVKA